MTILCGSSPVTVTNTVESSVQWHLSENDLYPRISGVSKRQHRAVKKRSTYKERDLGQVSNSMNLSLFIFNNKDSNTFQGHSETLQRKCFVMWAVTFQQRLIPLLQTRFESLFPSTPKCQTVAMSCHETYNVFHQHCQNKICHFKLESHALYWRYAFSSPLVSRKQRMKW